VTSVDIELVLVALAAMVSPTTLTFSVLALVLGDRPVRTGLWFYAGAFGATLAVGVVAAFVIGDVASSGSSTPKTWVSIVDLVAGAVVLIYAIRLWRRPADPDRISGMIDRMSGLASSPAIAIIGAGAMLANPGGFIPLALKDISQLDLSTGGFIAVWAAFALVALLPLGIALLMLLFAPERAMRVLQAARGWLERHAWTIAVVIITLLGIALVRNGIAGLS
jgi:Sap-like sulfolipid-1-addressing protein